MDQRIQKAGKILSQLNIYQMDLHKGEKKKRSEKHSMKIVHFYSLGNHFIYQTLLDTRPKVCDPNENQSHNDQHDNSYCSKKSTQWAKFKSPTRL